MSLLLFHFYEDKGNKKAVLWLMHLECININTLTYKGFFAGENFLAGMTPERVEEY